MPLPKERTPLKEIQPLRAYEIEISESCDPITGREFGKHTETVFIERIKGDSAICWNMTTSRKETLPITFLRFFGTYREDV